MIRTTEIAILTLATFASTLTYAAEPLFPHDVSGAWRKAQHDRRPLVLFFTMDGCAACSTMKQKTLRDAQVVNELQKSFVTATAHDSRYATLADKLGVEIFPTTVVICHKHHVIDKIAGYTNPRELRGRLQRVLTHALKPSVECAPDHAQRPGACQRGLSATLH